MNLFYIDILEIHFEFMISDVPFISKVCILFTNKATNNLKCNISFNCEFAVDNDMNLFTGSFNSDAIKVAVHEQNVYLLEPGNVSIRTFQVRNFVQFLFYYCIFEIILNGNRIFLKFPSN